jgi:hypothetical protein
MRNDVRAHQPFSQHFVLDILATSARQVHGDMLEAAFIRQATGPHIYNELDGPPRTSQRAHAIARARQRNEQRQG